MRTPFRVAASATAGTVVFFAAVLGIEYTTWFYNGPADPLADPVLNTVRFGTAGLLAIVSAIVVYPRLESPKP